MSAFLGAQQRLLWLVALAGAIIGAAVALYGVVSYGGSVTFATLQTACAVTGMACAVIPYLFASAVARLAGSTPEG
ncbi:MAG: hypothetical protein RIM84_11440 [Alphaproteobacteria bacterium]